MYKKPVIVFEGIEGSGKTSHLNFVSAYLKKKKIKFVKIREPGGSLNAEIIRKLILNSKSSFNKNTDLLLYLAARSENIELLKKFYKKKVILIDRFLDSTIAYQHFGFGIKESVLLEFKSYILPSLPLQNTQFSLHSFQRSTDTIIGDFPDLCVLK